MQIEFFWNLSNVGYKYKKYKIYVANGAIECMVKCCTSMPINVFIM